MDLLRNSKFQRASIERKLSVVGFTHFDGHWSNLGVFALPLLLQLLLPQPVDDDVDADVDRRADDEEQEPHVNKLEKIIIKFATKST